MTDDTAASGLALEALDVAGGVIVSMMLLAQLQRCGIIELLL